MIVNGQPYREKLVRLCESQDWRCAYCGVPFTDDRWSDTSASFDEVIPRCKGGSRTWENQVAACRACNNERGMIDAWQFHYQITRRQARRAKMDTPVDRPRHQPPGLAVSLGDRLKHLAENREEVPMTAARAAYFLMVYGRVPA